MRKITYPDGFPDIHGLAGRMHDLNQELMNPDPRRNWECGEVAWVYVRNKKMLAVGPVTYVKDRGPDEDLRNVTCTIHDVTAEDDYQSLTCVLAELFPTEELLLKAMFYVEEELPRTSPAGTGPA